MASFLLREIRGHKNPGFTDITDHFGQGVLYSTNKLQKGDGVFMKVKKALF